MEQNKTALYSLLLANVSTITLGKVKAKDGFSTAAATTDPLWLLTTLEDVMVNFEDEKKAVLALDDQVERIVTLKQGDSSNEDFVKLATKEMTIYAKRGTVYLWSKAYNDRLSKEIQAENQNHKNATSGTSLTDPELKIVRVRLQKVIQEEIMSLIILKKADKKRYANLQESLANSYLIGRDEYPTTLGAVLKLLNNYTDGNKTRGGVSFLQSSAPAEASVPVVAYAKGSNKSFYPEITCRICGLKGHFQTHCLLEKALATADTPANRIPYHGGRNATGQEVSIHSGGILLNQHSDAHINPNWILLDSESTEHIFRNKKLLTDVATTTDGELLRMHTSGGILDSDQKGRFGSFHVWYNPNCLANILSLALVSEKYRVTLDTEIENAFSVHISEEHVMKFIRFLPGLYLFDASNVDLFKLRTAFSFLSTVASNKKNFKQQEIRKADDAIILNRRTNHVANNKFVRVVKDNWIRNNPVTVGDVRRSHKIYGPPLPAIKGRTRYQESPRVQDTDIIQIPTALYEDLKHVTLCADFHYVNGVTVFHSISRRLDYRTVSFPLSRSQASIVNELQDIFKIYHARGFRIVELHADNEFNKVEQDILPVRLRCCGVDDHVPEIERSVQTQKNENRTVCHAMPYKCFPRVMVRELVTQGNEFLNAFGTKDSVADGLSPRNIIDNLPHIDYNDLKYEFGQYVQLHVTERVTNTMKSRSIGAIVLGPRRIQGRYNYMSLETGAVIDGRVVAVLPLTAEVIDRVESLGREQKQPFRVSKMLKYEWRPGQIVGDDDAYLTVEDENQDHGIIPEPVLPALPDAGPNPFAVDGPALPGAEEPNDLPEGEDMDQEDEQATAENQGAPIDEDEEAQDENQGAPPDENKTNLNIEDEIKVEEVDEDSDDEWDDEEPESRREEKERRENYFSTNSGDDFGRGKRERTAPSFSFLQTQFPDLTQEGKDDFFQHAWDEYQVSGKTNLLERYTTGFIFAQMTAKQGIKKYGREAELQLIAEFKQLIEYKTFHGRKAEELSFEQRKKAANMINLIEEKINRGHTPENPIIKG